MLGFCSPPLPRSLLSCNSRRVLMNTDLFYFTIIEATVLLGSLKALQMALYPCLDLCFTTHCKCGGLQRVPYTSLLNCGTLHIYKITNLQISTNMFSVYYYRLLNIGNVNQNGYFTHLKSSLQHNKKGKGLNIFWSCI